jgi:hypothetical protein
MLFTAPQKGAQNLGRNVFAQQPLGLISHKWNFINIREKNPSIKFCHSHI